MRIAQLTAGATSSGAELFYERMTLLLSQYGQQVFPIIDHDPGHEVRLRTAGLTTKVLDFGGIFDFSTKKGIREILRAQKAEIALAWTGRAATFLPEGPWTNIGRLDGYFALNEFAHCEYLAGSTHSIANFIVASGFPKANVLYLPDFVDDFSREDPVVRATLGVPERAPLMLGLGPLQRAKGFDTLIRAAALLPDMYCVIAGEGPERAALTKLIAELRLGAR